MCTRLKLSHEAKDFNIMTYQIKECAIWHVCVQFEAISIRHIWDIRLQSWVLQSFFPCKGTIWIFERRTDGGVRRAWWIQYDAPAHHRIIVRDRSHALFPGHVVGLGHATEWPPRSPDNRHLSRLTFYSGVAANRWEYSSVSAWFQRPPHCKT